MLHWPQPLERRGATGGMSRTSGVDPRPGEGRARLGLDLIEVLPQATHRDALLRLEGDHARDPVLSRVLIGAVLQDDEVPTVLADRPDSPRLLRLHGPSLPGGQWSRGRMS